MNIRKVCANCKFKVGKYCDYVWLDNVDYPHNNSDGFGIEAYADDDSGMDVRLRVDDDFGCVKFVDRDTKTHQGKHYEH